MEYPLRNQQFGKRKQGNIFAFFYLPHHDLENLMYFSLLTYTQAGGKVWSHTSAIPMGGPFGAQSADLRSVCVCVGGVHQDFLRCAYGLRVVLNERSGLL